MAKHRILIAYLKAWMPILSHQSRQIGGSRWIWIRYIDAFAGPGVYQRGEKGSPILALEAALTHAHAFPIPVRFTFIEDDEERCQVLRGQLYPYQETVARSGNVILDPPINKACQSVLAEMLDESERSNQRFGPALIFLDQFGYSAVRMELVGRILRHPQCEIFSFFFWRDLDRFITDKQKWSGISAAFGSEDWRPAIQMSGHRREKFMLDLYVRAIKEQAGANFAWPFVLFDHDDRVLCWLVFATNSIRGLEEMKRAMWTVDESGSFAFSDKTGFDQPLLFRTLNQDFLANSLAKELAGQRITVGKLKEFVMTKTPFVVFTPALNTLEQEGTVHVINPPPRRRRGTYSSDDLVLEFTSVRQKQLNIFDTP